VNPTDFPEQFYIDLAVGVAPFADICAMYRLDPAAVGALENDPDFRRLFLSAQQAVDDDGSAFRARCNTLVSQNVAAMGRMIVDPDVPPSTRLEVFRTLAKYANLEPVKEAAAGPPGPSLVFNIYAPDGTPMLGTTLVASASPQPDPVPLPESVDSDEPVDLVVRGFF
jgi:hypothetical protein